jgi:hypothetical protein
MELDSGVVRVSLNETKELDLRKQTRWHALGLRQELTPSETRRGVVVCRGSSSSHPAPTAKSSSLLLLASTTLWRLQAMPRLGSHIE